MTKVQHALQRIATQRDRMLRTYKVAEAIIQKAPEVADNVSVASSEWVQISSLDRERVKRLFHALAVGRWERKALDDGRLEYQGYFQGALVVIYGADPPTSCRIEIETVEVPATTKTIRKLICK